MSDPVCRSCGSSDVIPDDTVYDHDSTSWRPLAVTVPLAEPDRADVLGVTVTRGVLTSPLAARVCGSCGAVELYAPDAAARWAATRR